MERKGRGTALEDAFAFLLNVFSAVMIVFVNKILMDSTYGFKFAFATTLCAFHFIASASALWIAEGMAFIHPASMPLKEMMIFTAVAIFSVASLNLSLLTNSVGFYQISKLCVIPFVCAVERLWIGKHFSWPVLASAGVVMSGVAVVTVSDVEVRPLGLIIAGTSVVLSGMQQILCAKMQSDLGLASHQLLANSAPAQGVILWMFGPYLDKAITGHSFMAYEWNIQAIGVLCASCTLAILVNVSQFMCLGRFSAFTFQILGHAKTMLVLIIAWLFLGDTLSPRKALGMSLAILGMIMYGVCMKNQAKAVRKVPVQVVAQAGGVTPRRGSTGGADPEKCSLLK